MNQPIEPERSQSVLNNTTRTLPGRLGLKEGLKEGLIIPELMAEGLPVLGHPSA